MNQLLKLWTKIILNFFCFSLKKKSYLFIFYFLFLNFICFLFSVDPPTQNANCDTVGSISKVPRFTLFIYLFLTMLYLIYEASFFNFILNIYIFYFRHLFFFLRKFETSLKRPKLRSDFLHISLSHWHKGILLLKRGGPLSGLNHCQM